MCCKGAQTQYSLNAPKETQALQAALANYLSGKLGKPANTYPGPVSSQINPLMTGAANIMSNYAGMGNYQAPGYNYYNTFLPAAMSGAGMGAGTGGGSGAGATTAYGGGGSIAPGGVGSNLGNPQFRAMLGQFLGQPM